MTVENTGAIDNGRQEMTLKFGPERSAAGFAYKLWFYPERQLIVYINLGQSEAFQHPDGSNNWYTGTIVNSFKLVQ